MFPLLFGIASGALGGLLSFASSMRAGAAQRQQASIMQANAEIARQNADMEKRKSEHEAYEQDRARAKLRREFRDTQGHNRIALGAGNVDMMSGSALDVSLGNIDAFASDMADNAYSVAMKRWEGEEKRKSLYNQAAALDNNATYLQRTAETLGSSLLTAGLSGGMGFLGGYSMAGGSLSRLFGFGGGAAKTAAAAATGGKGLSAISGGATNWQALSSPEQLAAYARIFGGK